jgi:hypothetical protein
MQKLRKSRVSTIKNVLITLAVAIFFQLGSRARKLIESTLSPRLVQFIFSSENIHGSFIYYRHILIDTSLKGDVSLVA